MLNNHNRGSIPLFIYSSSNNFSNILTLLLGFCATLLFHKYLPSE